MTSATDTPLDAHRHANADETQVAGIGSPAYMSPQQVKEHPLTHQTDIYSLGVVMYQLLTGTLPFQGTSKPEVYGKIRKGQYRLPKQCSANCRDLIAKMLTVDPNARPDAATCSHHPWFAEMEEKEHHEVTQNPAITK